MYVCVCILVIERVQDKILGLKGEKFLQEKKKFERREKQHRTEARSWVLTKVLGLTDMTDRTDVGCRLTCCVCIYALQGRARKVRVQKFFCESERRKSVRLLERQ